MRAHHRLIASLFALGLVSTTAFAEDVWPSRVGRVSLAEPGTVLRIGTGIWMDAAVNVPIAAGTSLRTGDGRAEIRLAGTALALAPGTEVEIVRLDDDAMTIALRHGRIGFWRGPRGEDQTAEIDTARGGIWPSAPGQYEISAGAADAPMRVAAFIGTARLAGAGLDTSIVVGDEANVTGVDKTASVATGPAAADGFAVWWRARADVADSEPPRHVPPAMTGAAALAANGKWGDSDFGTVWFPDNVPAGWTPFRYGSWRFLPPWGWTWIDDASWGFAPSHYGRWVRIPGADPETGRWGWLPGAGEPNPVYVPAAVAFLGTSSVGLSYAGGAGPAIAWFPLGPGEAYWPERLQDAAAIRRMNAGSAGDLSVLAPGPDGGPPAGIVNAPYRNRRFASAVPRPIFLDGKAVAPSLVPIPEQRLEQAPLILGSLGIGPPAPHLAAAARPVAAVARAAIPAGKPVLTAPQLRFRAIVATLRERLRERMSLRRPIKPAPRLSPVHSASVRPEPLRRDFAAERDLLRQ